MCLMELRYGCSAFSGCAAPKQAESLRSEPHRGDAENAEKENDK